MQKKIELKDIKVSSFITGETDRLQGGNYTADPSVPPACWTARFCATVEVC